MNRASHWEIGMVCRPLVAALIAAALVSGPATAHAQTYPPCAGPFTSLGAFPAGNVVFDTTTLTFNGAPGGVVADGNAVFVFDSINVAAGNLVIGVGTRPLVLLSKSEITIAGTVSVAGQDGRTDEEPASGGAGGGEGGFIDLEPSGDQGHLNGLGPGGGTVGVPVIYSSAGGGGFGGEGGDGALCPVDGGTPGRGGSAYGNLAAALQGGSGGAAGRRLFVILPLGGPGGGGGGGGLFLGAFGTLSISAGGVVTADGGDGGPGGNAYGPGGGSGGGIVLFAAGILNNGLVTAVGGEGGDSSSGPGGGGGGGGRILVESLGSEAVGAGVYTAAGGVAGTAGDPCESENGAVGVVQIGPGFFVGCGITTAAPVSIPAISTFGLVALAVTLGSIGFLLARLRS